MLRFEDFEALELRGGEGEERAKKDFLRCVEKIV